MKQSIRSRLFNFFLMLIRRPIWNQAQLHALRKRLAGLDMRAEGRAEKLCLISVKAINHCDVDVLQPLDHVEAAGQGRHILFFHGGAYCLRSPHTYRAMLAGLCVNVGAVGILPDYRLAPEHPHPAGIDDCFESYRMLLDMGVAAKDIAFCGDSAGGGLVLSVLAMARDAGLPLPASASLLSPAGDWGLTGASFYENEGRDPLFRLSSFLFFRSLYIGNYQTSDPAVSPLLSSFAGYPPMYFSASSTELLRDVATEGAAKARAAGIEVEMDLWPGHCHDVQLMSFLPDSRIALNKVCDFMNKHWTASR